MLIGEAKPPALESELTSLVSRGRAAPLFPGRRGLTADLFFFLGSAGSLVPFPYRPPIGQDSLNLNLGTRVCERATFLPPSGSYIFSLSVAVCASLRGLQQAPLLSHNTWEIFPKDKFPPPFPPSRNGENRVMSL